MDSFQVSRLLGQQSLSLKIYVRISRSFFDFSFSLLLFWRLRCLYNNILAMILNVILRLQKYVLTLVFFNLRKWKIFKAVLFNECIYMTFIIMILLIMFCGWRFLNNKVYPLCFKQVFLSLRNLLLAFLH